MAKKISSNDLFEKEDIFEGIRDSANKTIKKLTKMKLDLQKIAKQMKTAFNNVKFENSKGINQMLQLVEKANKLNKESISIDKAKQQAMSQKTQAEIELLAIEKQRQQLQQEKLKTQKLEAQQQKRLNAERKKTLKTVELENNAYKKLVKNTRDLKNQSKQLGAEMLLLEQSGKKNTREYRKLAQTYKTVTTQAQQGDAQLKKLDKTVGDNFRNVGNYKNALAGLRNGLAQLGLAFGIGQIVRTGATAIIDFNQAIADLSAITGASGKDLEFYKQKANELGRSVEGGASAVVEAYKLIGSAKPELLENAEALNKLTESAITLSQASGLELPEASKQLTDAMNQFGASADDAGKFIDVLASGAKFGSAEIPQITEALLKFGAIAKSTNISVQESTGAIELLAEKGLKGAEAGTKLRNAMLKLSAPDALPKKAVDLMNELGISFEDISDQSKPFSERLKALQPLLQNNTAMVKVFGKENVVAGQILLENTDRLEELTVQMDTNGVAQEQANKRTNTLGFALLELKNSFIGLFTELGTGEGAFQNLIDGLKWFGQNLPAIITIIGKLVRAFLVYKGTLLALKAINFVRTGGLKDMGAQMAKQIPLTKAYAREQKRLATETKGANSASKGFKTSLASLGIGVAIGLATELAIKIYDIASGYAEARKQKDLSDKAIAKGTKEADALIGKYNKQLDEELRLIDKEARINLAREKNEKKRNEIREKAIADQKASTDKLRKEIQDQINEIARESAEVSESYGARYARRYASENITERALGRVASKKIRNEQNSIINANNVKIRALKKQRAQLNKQSEEYGVQLIEETEANENYGITIKDNSDALSTKTKTLADYNTELNETNEYLSKQKKLLFDISQIERQKDIEALNRSIDSEFTNQMNNISETGEFDATKINSLIEERYKLEKAKIEEKRDFEIQAVDDRIDATEKKEFAQLVKNRERLIASADDNAEAIAEINKDFDKKDDELIDQQLKRREDAELEKVKITKTSNNEILDLERGKNESIKENTEELNNEVSEKENDQKDKDLEKDKLREQEKRNIAKATADYLIKLSNERIKKIDEEISKAEKQQTFLEDLAKKGNINAQQSLAENQKLIEEANRKKEAELKNQARIKLAESIYSTYSSKVEAGVDNPLAETIRDATLLQTFIASLPTFMEGTEDTGKNGRGIDGKGGFQAVLHPNERVIPKQLNDKIGALTNEELTRVAIEYNNRKLLRVNNQESSIDLMLLVNEMQDLKNVVKNKPEFSAEIGNITKTSFEILEKTRKGNTTVYNRFNVKA